LDLRTSRIRRIYTFDKPPDAWGGGLSVSPDGKWLLYSQIDLTRFGWRAWLLLYALPSWFTVVKAPAVPDGAGDVR
jgi:hypothetical protein